MAEIIIPGTDKVLVDGTILIFNDYGDVKYIAHNGYYNWGGEQHNGWYGVSIPDQVTIPIVNDMLIKCEVVYYPNSNCTCRYPSGNIPFSTDDKYQLLRAFITVDTMNERDALAPNLIPSDLPNGKLVRVNKPNNIDYDPKYYMYVYSQDLTSASWEYYDIYNKPEGGIPKSDLSEDVINSLDLADSAVQLNDFNLDFDIDSSTNTIGLSQYGKMNSCVLDWLVPIRASYYVQAIEENLAKLNYIRNLDNSYQSQWGRHLVYIKISNRYYPSIVVRNSNNIITGIQTIVYNNTLQKLEIYNISGTTVSNYSQEVASIIEYDVFDEYSNQAASQYTTAQWIYGLINQADGIAGLDSNGLITSSILPIASANDLGAIKPGTWISIDSTTGVASVNIPPQTFDTYGAAAAVENAINELIPNSASAQNQLADKNFVNSSIATNTANFIGTFNSVEELEAYSGSLTNNDYAFVTEVTAGQVTAYERWKYNATQQAWLYEYTLNNSSFTSDQWAAINSTITAELVTAYSGHIADTTIHVTAADKQNWNSKVTSVNNKTGVVNLTYSDVGADPDGAALAVSQQLNTHADNTHIHTNDDEKSAWYARAILTVSGEDLIISYIECPTISLSESVVSWNPVYNATSYKVYADNGETTELVATVTTTSIDLSAYILSDGTYTVTVVASSNTYGDSAPSDSVEWVLQTVSYVLDENSWEIISRVSADGKGADYWAVGDMKQIHLEGTVGTLSLNTDLNVYIMGFDHNSTLEGTGITFGSFKTADSSHKDVCLIDSHYGSSSTNGSKWFNISHWGNFNYGGWAGCDMRYDILGSTDVAPSSYGSAPTTSRVGYDATSTCATNPVANTLMSCLSSDLRAVMKPMTKYTDNASGGSHNAEANVTASVDYLPLLAEYEIFGARSYANEHEYKKQAQYAYYIAGNSKVKYQHSSTGSTAIWWGRSPYYIGNNLFCLVDSGGGASNLSAQYATGVVPAFLI